MDQCVVGDLAKRGECGNDDQNIKMRRVWQTRDNDHRRSFPKDYVQRIGGNRYNNDIRASDEP